MKFSYNLDYSEPIDATELLGEFCVFGDNNTKIIEKDTFIDSWFFAFCEGVICLKHKKECVIEIPEECDSLSFVDGGRLVRYGKQFAAVSDFEQMSVNLKEALKLFLDEVANSCGEEALPYLRNIFLKLKP